MIGTSMRGLVSAATGVVAVAVAGVRQVSRMVSPPGAESVQGMPELVRSEVRRSLKNLGLASPSEVADLRHRVALLEGRLAADEAAGATSPAKKAAARKSAARKPRKAATKKAAPPSPVATSGIPDTPATVAERATVFTPAEPEEGTPPPA